MTRWRAPLAALALLVAATACADEGGIATRDIVATIPWSDGEAPLTYSIVDDGKERGRATLSITREDGHVLLEQSSSDGEGNSDVSVVTADPATLKPLAMRRTVINEDGRAVVDASYEAEIVRIRQTNFDPPDETTPDNTRENPLRLPEHGYENHSSLFLWRTITFEENYTVTYTTIISNRRETQDVTLTVVGRERVETPAGQFDAWHLRIEPEESDAQDAWYATSPEHRLLVYDNNDSVFLLVADG